MTNASLLILETKGEQRLWQELDIADAVCLAYSGWVTRFLYRGDHIWYLLRWVLWSL